MGLTGLDLLEERGMKTGEAVDFPGGTRPEAEKGLVAPVAAWMKMKAADDSGREARVPRKEKPGGKRSAVVILSERPRPPTRCPTPMHRPLEERAAPS